MADNNFEILIKFGLSKEKAVEAVNELKKLEEQGKRAGNETAKSAETANAKFKDVKKSVELVSGQLGQLGQVLRYVFNPAILGAALLAKSIGEVWTSFQTFLGGLKDAATNAARSVGNIKQAMLELDIERAKADAAFKSSLEDFERQSKRRIEVIGLEKEAVLQLLDAREKADLAAAKSPEEQAAVKERYASARKSAQSSASQKELAAREANLNELEQRAKDKFSQGRFASDGRSPERVKLDLKKMPGELASLDEQIAEQEKVVAKLSGITTFAGAFPYINDPEAYQAQAAAFIGSKSTLASMRAERKRIAGRQLSLTGANASYDAAEGLFNDVRTGRQDLSNARTDLSYRQQTNWRAGAIASGQGAAGELISSAAAGADAIRGGGKATADQSAAIGQLTALLSLQNQNQATVLSVLGRMNDNEQNFKNSLKVVAQRQ